MLFYFTVAPDGNVSIQLLRKTQTSLRFSWNGIPCTHRNGAKFRYSLQLLKRQDEAFTLITLRPNVDDVTHQFDNLKACGEYKLKVMAKNNIAAVDVPAVSQPATTSPAGIIFNHCSGRDSCFVYFLNED